MAPDTPPAAQNGHGTASRLMVPMMVATVTATAITRYLDGYSIYSARLTE